MRKWWISTAKTTGQVNSDKGIIVFAPPVWHKFVGMPLVRLIQYLRCTQTGYKHEEIK
jgi:hypothetical protein